MAKKKRLTRKQIKQRQKSKKARTRHQTQGKQTAKFSHEEEKALAAFMSKGDAAMLESFTSILFNSSKWINEPEFAEIFFPPMQSMEMFVSEMGNRGYSPQKFEKLDQDARDDIHFEITQTILSHLLTENKRQEILAALDALKRRLQRFRKKEANEVILAKLFLTDFAQQEGEDPWLMTSLVQTLVERSIATGFELMETAGPLTTQADDHLSILDLLENKSEKVEKKATKLLNRVPGLRKFMEKQSDKMWDEGVDAIFNGDLNLAFFTEDELSGAAQIMQSFAEELSSSKQPDKAAKKQMASFVDQIDEYVAGLMTPDRFNQLRSRVREIIQKEQVDRHWLPFMTILHGYLKEEDAVENERPFLVRAIMGEIRTVIAVADEKD